MMRALPLAALCLTLAAGCVERSPERKGDTAPARSGGTTVTADSVPRVNDRVYDLESGTLTLTNSLQPGVEQTLRFDRYGSRVALESRQGDTAVVQISADGYDVMYNTLEKAGVSRPIRGNSYFLKNFIPDLRTLDTATLRRQGGDTLPPRTIAGRPTTGMRLQHNNRRVSVWSWRGVPMRVELEGKDGGRPLVIEVTEVAEESVPADAFAVPEDVKIDEIH